MFSDGTPLAKGQPESPNSWRHRRSNLGRLLSALSRRGELLLLTLDAFTHETKCQESISFKIWGW